MYADCCWCWCDAEDNCDWDWESDEALDDGEGNIFFKALQLMQDAQLLVSIIIDKEGNIIINQGIDIKLKDKLLCTGSI